MLLEWPPRKDKQFV
jgi:hypothetical protein